LALNPNPQAIASLRTGDEKNTELSFSGAQLFLMGIERLGALLSNPLERRVATELSGQPREKRSGGQARGVTMEWDTSESSELR
jgi:hypothetical protein